MTNRFLNRTALCLVALSITSGSVHAQANRAPLQPQPFDRLPMGSVHAKTWLKHQLELQRDGLTGHAEQLYEDIGQSDWITGGDRGDQYAWERGPYYARGLIALGHVLDDDVLKKRAQKWVDKFLASQRDNGDFGPRERNWWANMVVLYCLRDHYEATGDARVPPFIEKYLRFQLAELPTRPLGEGEDWLWPKARGGDNIEIVVWMYNRTGEAWLIDLAKLLIEQTNQWSQYYADGKGDNWYPEHIVNTMQGLKTPPLQYLVTGDDLHREGYANALRSDGWLMKKYGRADGMLSGTEPLTSRNASEGTELCAIVERIMSDAVATRILGDVRIADGTERVAYNALPAALMHNGDGLRYYILPNQPKCTNEFLRFRNNGKGTFAICPSPHSGYPCCRSNLHIGWPAFVHNMWMATTDGGLAVVAYGPNTVAAKVGDDRASVTIDQKSDYPFRETSTLTIAATEPVAFPLALRIPAWCTAPEVNVNGEKQAGVKPGTYHRIERTWRDGDRVEARFPMNIAVEKQERNSLAITRGPLVDSLLIDEDAEAVREYLDGKFHAYEIRPASTWNYALALDDREHPTAEVTLSDAIPTQPFRATAAPIRLTMKGAVTDEGGWGTYNEFRPARAESPPPSPISTHGDVEAITLVPYGSTEIRITYFPWFEKASK